MYLRSSNNRSFQVLIILQNRQELNESGQMGRKRIENLVFEMKGLQHDIKNDIQQYQENIERVAMQCK